MKKRYFAILLAAILCFAVAQASLPSVSADEALVVSILPGYTLVEGVVEDNQLYLLMKNPDDALVFVGCTQLADESWGCYVSSPLPEKTILGVENYTTSLGVPVPEGVGLFTVTLAPFHDGVWGVAEVSYRGDDPIRMGRTWLSPSQPHRGTLGSHPWSDIAAIDWATLPKSYDEAAAQVEAGEMCVISDCSSASSYLFAEPEKNAEIIMHYLNGTPARPLKEKGAWTRVAVGSVEGWIRTENLVFGNDMNSVASMLYPTSSVYGSITFYTAPDYDSKAYTVDDMVECYCLDLPVSDWTQVWNPYTDEYLFTEAWNFMMADG